MASDKLKLTPSQLQRLWGALSDQDRDRFTKEIVEAVAFGPPAPPPRKRGRPKVAPGVELKLRRAWEAFVADNPTATISRDGARWAAKQFGVKTSRSTLIRLLATGQKMNAAPKRLDAILAEPASFVVGPNNSARTVRDELAYPSPSFVALKPAQ